MDKYISGTIGEINPEYVAQLEECNSNLQAEIVHIIERKNVRINELEKLQAVIEIFASANAWNNFGDCRAYGGTGVGLSPAELDKLAEKHVREKWI